MYIEKKYTSKKARAIKDYVVITFGLSLYALGWTAFLLPHKITSGGISGIGALVYYKSGVPMWITFLSINLVLLVAAIKVLGFRFSIRTIYGVAVLTLFLSVFQHFITVPFVTEEAFMACVIGGILCGTGIGIVFTANGSSGGTDIVAAIINKYKNITLGRAILYCDVIIISSSYLLFHSIEKIVYGLVVMLISTYTVDLVVNGVRQSVQFFIFSGKYKEIADQINKDVNRGVTVVDGMGWYSKQPVKVIIVMAKKSESVRIFHLVKQIDPDAFISQSSVIGVYGKGFDKIKA
ncbi:MAG: YitT family protein [Candidatus Azobacteroides sp.]|jgi:uncharacterized membrane-anchored protein YitT (DUF2179 family)|nr:YitT family protein [Candidatus Azobacteroides sp.]